MFTAICSFLHFLVDGICAFAMFFGATGMSMSHTGAVIYNCCAFALQFPIGVLLDAYLSGSHSVHRDAETSLRHTAVMAVAGFIITSVGALLIILNGTSVRPGSDISAVILLGLGNAIFHVGGGVTTVTEDRLHDKRGMLLGIFVAPGAVGLYLGKLLSDTCVRVISSPSGKVSASELGIMFVLVIAAEVVVMAVLMNITKRPPYTPAVISLTGEGNVPDVPAGPLHTGSTRPGSISLSDVFIVLPCFIVVVLRSYSGFTVSYPQRVFPLALIAALIPAFGKAAGGIAGSGLGRFFGNRYKRLDVYYGYRIVTISALLLAAAAFLFIGSFPADMLSSFAINMTMPITLYILCSHYPDHSGSMFGLLTLGLFIGYIPSWAGFDGILSDGPAGAVISLVSLVLLMISFTYLWSDRKRT